MADLLLTSHYWHKEQKNILMSNIDKITLICKGMNKRYLFGDL